jgi:hypothetical protein
MLIYTAGAGTARDGPSYSAPGLSMLGRDPPLRLAPELRAGSRRPRSDGVVAEVVDTPATGHQRDKWLATVTQLLTGLGLGTNASSCNDDKNKCNAFATAFAKQSGVAAATTGVRRRLLCDFAVPYSGKCVNGRVKPLTKGDLGLSPNAAIADEDDYDAALARFEATLRTAERLRQVTDAQESVGEE